MFNPNQFKPVFEFVMKTILSLQVYCDEDGNFWDGDNDQTNLVTPNNIKSILRKETMREFPNLTNGQFKEIWERLYEAIKLKAKQHAQTLEG